MDATALLSRGTVLPTSTSTSTSTSTPTSMPTRTRTRTRTPTPTPTRRPRTRRTGWQQRPIIPPSSTPPQKYAEFGTPDPPFQQLSRNGKQRGGAKQTPRVKRSPWLYMCVLHHTECGETQAQAQTHAHTHTRTHAHTHNRDSLCPHPPFSLSLFLLSLPLSLTFSSLSRSCSLLLALLLARSVSVSRSVSLSLSLSLFQEGVCGLWWVRCIGYWPDGGLRGHLAARGVAEALRRPAPTGPHTHQMHARHSGRCRLSSLRHMLCMPGVGVGVGGGRGQASKQTDTQQQPQGAVHWMRRARPARLSKAVLVLPALPRARTSCERVGPGRVPGADNRDHHTAMTSPLKQRGRHGGARVGRAVAGHKSGGE